MTLSFYHIYHIYVVWKYLDFKSTNFRNTYLVILFIYLLTHMLQHVKYWKIFVQNITNYYVWLSYKSAVIHLGIVTL